MDNNHTGLDTFAQIFFAFAIGGLLFFGAACLTSVFGRSNPNGAMAIAAAISFSTALISSIILAKR